MSELMPQTGLIEQPGKCLLPTGDGVVTQLRVDFTFTVMIESWIDNRTEAQIC
ncbi:hypothetical protein [Micromonospora sp. NPDC049891]|uniref:hypothetical protein n=1 Tax=Micromonospora sp. NPDC049891 TaxID=3155655 RepID=UPI0033C998C4